ncbi:MAG: zinc ribbon domain-containing protein [Candidatus Omnitrophota bacterium]
MPFYDYYCESNGQTVEVFHPMNVRLKTWGEVCAQAKIHLGQTPPDTAVLRLMSGVTPTVFRVKGLDKDAPPGKKLLV